MKNTLVALEKNNFRIGTSVYFLDEKDYDRCLKCIDEAISPGG
jgi:hypothetical protein